MKIGVATDIHLDHYVAKGPNKCIAGLARGMCANVDALIVTGDIATFARRDLTHEFVLACPKPVRLVFGNHDYWGAKDVWEVVEAARQELGSFYLPTGLGCGLRQYPEDLEWCLIGLDGWYDTRSGYFGGAVTVDHKYIGDMPDPYLALPDFRDYCKVYAKYQVNTFRYKLEARLRDFKRVIVATHFPVLPQAVFSEWYDDPQMHPFSVNTYLGEMLLEVAEIYRDRDIMVFTGHAHGKGTHLARENLFIVANEAQYKHPKLGGVLDTDSWEWQYS